MTEGKIVQCIGAVIDVEFPRDAMPSVYDALVLPGTELTLEVQQQLGDGVVHTIALGSSDGYVVGSMYKIPVSRFQFLLDPKLWAASWTY